MPPTTRHLSKVTVNGIKLQPTKVFDTFWRWCAERKAMDDRRRAGLPYPWTTDRNLTQGYFCMPYRVLDRGCQFLISQVIQKGSQDPREILFRILLYDIFTKISTYELLKSSLNNRKDQQPSWKSYNRHTYESILRSAFQRGISLYTGAFITPTGRSGKSSKENFCHHLDDLETFMKDDVLLNRIKTAESMGDIFDFIKKYRGMGNFTAYQLLLNISYSSLLSRFSDMDFVVPGLGCQSGLQKLFTKGSLTLAKGRDPKIFEEIIRWMADTQDEHFERLGLDSTFSRLSSNGSGSAGIPLQLADIEHSICEVDKYARLVHPDICMKRKTIKRTYKYVEGRTLPPVVIPKVWGMNVNADSESEMSLTSNRESTFSSSLDTIVASHFSRNRSSSLDTFTENSDVSDLDVDMRDPEVLSDTSEIEKIGEKMVDEIEEILNNRPISAKTGSNSDIKYLVRHKSSKNSIWISEDALFSTPNGVEALRAYHERLFVIKRIGDVRIRKGSRRREFLVFWEGYGDDDATWEPERTLMKDAPLAVKKFLERVGPGLG